MKATQFRIGNLVSLNGKEFEVTLQSLYEGANLDWKPLPVTKERLLRFGFKEVEISNGDFILTIQKDKGLLMGEYQIWVDLGIENETNKISISVVCDSQWLITKNKYVHQLQNLYFALTQKELRIKEDVNSQRVLITDLDISVRLLNCLKNEWSFDYYKYGLGITYLDEISNYTKKEVYRVRHFGDKSMTELEELMFQFDIEFKEE